MDKIEALVEKIFLHFIEKESRSYPLLLSKDQIEEEVRKLIEDYDEMLACQRLGFEIHGQYQAWKLIR